MIAPADVTSGSPGGGHVFIRCPREIELNARTRAASRRSRRWSPRAAAFHRGLTPRVSSRA